MRYSSTLALIFGFILVGGKAFCSDTPSRAFQERQARTEWFREARFGLFIHWGVYAIPARGEWVRSAEQMSIKDYQVYVDEFNPSNYDPHAWARAARNAGMKYAVMTAKHHDGFCMWDTDQTDYKVTNTPAGRDLLKEYVEAFRAEGLKVGFYYSLLDWYHPDYPAFGDRQHPMRANPGWKDKEHHFDRYLDYMHAQVEELVTRYGKIDIMWFDFSYWDFRGEKWRASDLVHMVRKYQPQILIDNRLGGDMELRQPPVYAGDFDGPEQGVPREPIRDEDGFPLPWEACITLNDSWGYSARDHNWKSPEFVIRTLVNCVSKNGNLLVNVGPTAKGEIPEESLEILETVGKWMNKNGESIYGCGIADLQRPEWGRFTQKGNRLFAHLFHMNLGHISLKGMKDKVVKARLLSDGSEIILSEFWNKETSTFDAPDDLFMNFGKPVQLTFPLPDKIDTVVELTLKK